MKHSFYAKIFATLFIGTAAQAGPISFGEFQFETDAPQSSWGPGPAVEIAETIPFLADWDESLSFGDIASIGSVPNPAYETANGVYVGANATYNTAQSAYNSANTAYNNCLSGTFGNAITCSVQGGLRLTALGVRNAAKTVRDEALAIRNALPAELDLGDVGSKITVASAGEIGVELDYKLSAGSVDPKMTFAIGADVPDVVDAGEAFSISATQNLLSGEVDSTAPGFEFSTTAIVDVDLSLSAIACAGGCISGGATVVDVDKETEIIAVDNQETRFLQGLIDELNSPVPISLTFPTGTLEAQVFLGAPTPVTPPLGLEINGIAVTNPQPVPPTIELAKASLTVPQIDTATQLIGGKLVAEGSDQVLKLSADLDGIIPQIPPGGLNFSFGPPGLNAGASFDAFDFKAGPTLDLTQKFEIDGEVIVDLQFSRAVSVNTAVGFTTVSGQTCLNADIGMPGCSILDLDDIIYEYVDQTSYLGVWSDLPDMKLYGDTTFMPTFSAAADMLSVLGLQFGASLDILFGRGDVNLGPLVFEVGPIYEDSFPFNPEFAAFDVFSDTFALSGFNSFVGESFIVRTTATTIAAVPVPPAALLLLTGIGAMRIMRRRRQIA